MKKSPTVLNVTNARYVGSENRESLYDLCIPENSTGQLIIFVHGFMGFKDWGAWHLVQDFFTNKGYAFCKFNLSHNKTFKKTNSKYKTKLMIIFIFKYINLLSNIHTFI